MEIIIILIILTLVFTSIKKKNKESVESSIKDEFVPSVSIDDIITYKQEGDMVYAYYNQGALDAYIYNRAKEKTGNFTSKERIKTETHKRALRYDDLCNIRHIVYNAPIPDGEYITTDDVACVIGLDILSAYYRDNNISVLDTWVYCGVKIFSKYDGYITNYYKGAKDSVILLAGFEINDGDLLFAIKLSQQKTDTENAVKHVLFKHNMLSREFLNNIPYITDICRGEWLVENYAKIEKGADVMEIEEMSVLKPRYREVIKSPYSGIIVRNDFGGKIRWGQHLYDVYPDEDKLKNNYPNQIKVITDEFTKKTLITGNLCGGNVSFRMGIVYMNLECFAGKNYLLVTYDRKEIILNKKCAIHLLMGDESVITLYMENNPTRCYNSTFQAKFPLTKHDIAKLEIEDFIRWKITNEEGIDISQGPNMCCYEYGDYSNLTREISYKIFREFVAEFNKLVRENITEYVEEHETPTQQNQPCFVYLMIDTTNNFHKIGISNNPRYREHTLQSDKPTIELICAKEFPSRAIAEAFESALHKTYASKRIRGEWFNLDSSDILELKQALQ